MGKRKTAVSHQRKRRHIRQGELSLILSCTGATKPSKEVVVWRCSVKKLFLEISPNPQATCTSLFFNKIVVRPASLLKKETLEHVTSCEFCKMSKNTFHYRTPLVAASASRLTRSFYLIKYKNK